MGICIGGNNSDCGWEDNGTDAGGYNFEPAGMDGDLFGNCIFDSNGTNYRRTDCPKTKGGDQKEGARARGSQKDAGRARIKARFGACRVANLDGYRVSAGGFCRVINSRRWACCAIHSFSVV